MTLLEKLKLTDASPRTPTTPLARKRIKLLGKLDQQIQAAQAEARDEEFVEEIRRWVNDDETGQRKPISFDRPVRKWWWQNQHGVWMISLRDGNRIVPLGKNQSSVEVGSIDQMVQTLETLRDAVAAGELDPQLETLVAQRKMPPSRKSKAAA
ncbi:MAG: hypothetical protein ABJM29_13030 [Rhizobiaceae bacterium]